jgi:hypothetical protein
LELYEEDIQMPVKFVRTYRVFLLLQTSYYVEAETSAEAEAAVKKAWEDQAGIRLSAEEAPAVCPDYAVDLQGELFPVSCEHTEEEPEPSAIPLRPSQKKIKR